MQWQLAEAKNRFSELVSRALSEGPQRVSRRDEVVVVLAQREYEKLLGKRLSFKDFIMQGPSFDGLVLERDPSPMRVVKP